MTLIGFLALAAIFSLKRTQGYCPGMTGYTLIPLKIKRR